MKAVNDRQKLISLLQDSCNNYEELGYIKYKTTDSFPQNQNFQLTVIGNSLFDFCIRKLSLNLVVNCREFVANRKTMNI